MTKKFPIKIVMLCMFILLILSLSAMFSISYAGWINNDKEFSTNVNIGWSDQEIVDAIEDILKPNTGEDFGGIIVNNDPNKVYGSTWTSGWKQDGFKATIDLNEGDTFIVAFFGRTWEKDKKVNEGTLGFLSGSCKISNANTESDYAIKLSEDKKTFIVVKSCKIQISVREGGLILLDDLLTIYLEDGVTEAAVNYPA